MKRVLSDSVFSQLSVLCYQGSKNGEEGDSSAGGRDLVVESTPVRFTSVPPAEDSFNLVMENATETQPGPSGDWWVFISSFSTDLNQESSARCGSSYIQEMMNF